MLNAFDAAREKSRGKRVQVNHGRAAEAEFRRWLSDFLPKRYGVTSGYIVSPGWPSDRDTPHFDVIIYDSLESPVLWIEGSPDDSPQGSSRAIPVEFVRCVIEVKASFSSTTMKQAIEHLGQLRPILSGIDDEREKFKLYLSRNFHCGVAFFDLKCRDQYSVTALNKAREGVQLRGFLGGLILRGQTHEQPLTGRINLWSSATATTSNVGKNKGSLLSGALSSSMEAGENLHWFVTLLWANSNFSQFAFDLIAKMQETFEQGRVSSWYGVAGPNALAP